MLINAHLSAGSVCQPTAEPSSPQLWHSVTIHNQREQQPIPRRRWLPHTSCGLYSCGTDGKQHSPPLVYTSNCRLMLDLSTREWRTLRTLWTFQILGLERRKSISSSDFLAVLQRYWLNDWNCWERRERCSRGIKSKMTAQVHNAEDEAMPRTVDWGKVRVRILLLMLNLSAHYLLFQSHLWLAVNFVHY